MVMTWGAITCGHAPNEVTGYVEYSDAALHEQLPWLPWHEEIVWWHS